MAVLVIRKVGHEWVGRVKSPHIYFFKTAPLVNFLYIQNYEFQGLIPDLTVTLTFILF